MAGKVKHRLVGRKYKTVRKEKQDPTIHYIIDINYAAQFTSFTGRCGGYTYARTKNNTHPWFTWDREEVTCEDCLSLMALELLAGV